MRYFFLAACFAVSSFLWAMPCAHAQLSAGAPGGGAPQPRPVTPDLAPPALPGAGDAPGLRSAPAPAQVNATDPTTALFTAVNSNDYNAAQDAVSRGADLSAQNALGETPLDLSIALNRNSITFMLLSARNEGGIGAAAPAPVQASQPVAHASKPKPMPVKLLATPHTSSMPAYSSNPGTPNPSAGFLGFGPVN